MTARPAPSGASWGSAVVLVAAAIGATVLAVVAVGLVARGVLDLGAVSPVRLLAAAGASLGLSLVGLALAAPVAIGTAVWARWLAPAPLRGPARASIEILGDLPPVVWVVAALVVPGFGGPEGAVVLVSLALGAIAAPSVARRALRALDEVAPARMTAARALGLGAAEAVGRVALPSASRGLARATLLGFSRTLGDAVVALALLAGFAPWAGLPMRVVAVEGDRITLVEGAFAAALVWAALALGVALLARRVTR